MFYILENGILLGIYDKKMFLEYLEMPVRIAYLAKGKKGNLDDSWRRMISTY